MDAAAPLSGLLQLDEEAIPVFARWEEDDDWDKPRRRGRTAGLEGWDDEDDDWDEDDEYDEDDEFDDDELELDDD